VLAASRLIGVVSASYWNGQKTLCLPLRRKHQQISAQIDTAQREIVFVEDAHIRPMMGNQALESLPSRHIPYSLVDPYILVHEAVGWSVQRHVWCHTGQIGEFKGTFGARRVESGAR